MTPKEFKAWFEGFTEAFGGCPTKAQWARIKERVAEIDGNPVTERVFIDRYWPTYVHRYYGGVPSWQYLTANISNGVGVSTTSNLAAVQGRNYNSLSAMNALGRNEAQSLAA